MKLLRIYMYIMALTLIGLCACDDGDTFTTSSSNRLTFSTDTVRLDTVFSTVPSSTRSFWVYNHSGKGLRCQDVRLEGGNQNGFRVNVDGTYLSPEQGYKAQEIEVRTKDSIRIYVEVTTPVAGSVQPKLLSDRLVFTLESGVEQQVALTAWSWDADFMRSPTFTTDKTLLATERPLVVYGPMTVAEGATLTIEPGSTVYFHDGASIDVAGRLVCRGTAGNPVTLRGDRLDRMFDYLPYDRVSGQWGGIRLRSTSYDNSIDFTDLHSSFDGLVVDSSDVSRQKLALSNSTIHNCQGYALRLVNSKATIGNCQLSNALMNCLSVDGGDVQVNNSTLAQYYPFDSNRQAALSFSALNHPLLNFSCHNSLITGYADGEMMGGKPTGDSVNTFKYNFANCIIRTPALEEGDEELAHFTDVTFEDTKDTVAYGMKHFVKVDGDKQYYDFHLRKESAAVDKGNPATASKTDHDGRARDERPDIGAYELEAEKQEQ